MPPKPRRTRRTGLWIAVAAGVCMVLGIVAVPSFISSDLGQDVLYDNVPSRAQCSEVPSREVAERAAPDFPAIDDADAFVIDKCSGAIIEVQYGSDDTRQKVEAYLQDQGTKDSSTGWWWRSTPVQLRNV